APAVTPSSALPRPAPNLQFLSGTTSATDWPSQAPTSFPSCRNSSTPGPNRPGHPLHFLTRSACWAQDLSFAPRALPEVATPSRASGQSRLPPVLPLLQFSGVSS